MFARRTVEEPRVEISSLVDVVFLLLIFFMVTTTFAQQQVVEVALPSTEGEAKQVEGNLPSCTIDASGSFSLDGEAVAAGGMRAALEARFESLQGADRVLFARIDRQAPFGVPAELFDLAGKLDIVIDFQTDPGDSGSRK